MCGYSRQVSCKIQPLTLQKLAFGLDEAALTKPKSIRTAGLDHPNELLVAFSMTHGRNPWLSWERHQAQYKPNA